MSRVYAVSFAPTAVTTLVDLFEIVPAAATVVKILGFEISQTTEFGDAEDEMLGLVMNTGFTSSGSGGSSATPAPLDTGASAAGFTAETLNTTQASTSGTAVFRSAFNVRGGYSMMFPGGMEVTTQDRVVLALTAAPVDSIDLTGTMWIEELGG